MYGVHAVAARLAADPAQVGRLYVREHPSGRLAALADAAAREAVAVERATPATLRELSGTDRHQGVVAAVAPFRYCTLEQGLERAPERVLVLDQVQDPQNLGALLRTAEASGVGLVVIPKDGAAAVTAVVEKAAAGAATRVPVARVVNVARSLRELKQAGYWVVGLAPRARLSLFGFTPPNRVALVLGGEHGLRPLVQQECHELLSIPMAGGAESLNVSVAGAVAMYELKRSAELFA